MFLTLTRVNTQLSWFQFWFWLPCNNLEANNDGGDISDAQEIYFVWGFLNSYSENYGVTVRENWDILALRYGGKILPTAILMDHILSEWNYRFRDYHYHFYNGKDRDMIITIEKWSSILKYKKITFISCSGRVGRKSPQDNSVCLKEVDVHELE